MRKRTMLLAAATALVTAASLGFGAGAMASASARVRLCPGIAAFFAPEYIATEGVTVSMLLPRCRI